MSRLYRNPVLTLSSHLNLLEDFDLINRSNDPFQWIPQGIYYDMIDNRNDFNISGFPLPIDNVIGYTNQQLFQSLDPDVKSMPQYRQKLLLENNNNQAIQVNALFSQYNY